VLRAFRDGDLDDFLAYRNDPGVARFQYWEGASPAEGMACETRGLSPSGATLASCDPFGIRSTSRWTDAAIIA
jgi:hypothetical protein